MRRGSSFAASQFLLVDQTRSGHSICMVIKNISEAKAELSSLLESVSKGEEVIISKAGVPIAQLIRFTGLKRDRVSGSLKGAVKTQDDFDVLPAVLAKAFGVKS